jgi:hypothetical protein
VPESPTFTGLLHDAALYSMEHQLHSIDVLGRHSWRVDVAEAWLRFDGAEQRTTTRLHVIGTAAPGPRSWLWAWAGWPGCAPEALELAESVRDFGRRNDIPLLTEPEIPFSELPGTPGDANLAAFTVLDAVKEVGGSWTAYTTDFGGGTRGAFLVEHPDFQLPPPEPERVMRILKRYVTDPPRTITDHRRALHSYATRRGLAAEVDEHRSKLKIVGPGLEVIIGFRPDGVVSAMSSTLGSPVPENSRAE